ncbi:MAG: glycosyltransferase family 39 protein [Theionarchaea archaeon]|nr:glycosyltransferase family 39 protein [Theionarchaea archaeon]
MVQKIYKRWEFWLLLSLYIFSVLIRLLPKLEYDSHLPAFQGDIWYRICMAQYTLENWTIPEPDIRYQPYGYVPMWYPPLSVFFFAFLSKITALDIPTVVTRILPFFEGISPISIFFLARYIYNNKVAAYSAIILAMTPSFIYWTGIGDPQFFILFLIPIFILFFLKYSRQELGYSYLIIMGILLGITFMVHLSYFIIILCLFMSLIYVLHEDFSSRPILAFFVLICISQLVAFWWWYPRNLYWWWIYGLTSSSGYYSPVQHFFEFGIVSAILGGLGLLYLGITKNRSLLLLFLWTLPLFLETQNETILQLVGRIDLAWSTLAKPLEGFRFYCFLAQPLAIAGGIFLYHLVEPRISRKFLYSAIVGVCLLNLYVYNIDFHLTNAGILRGEYDAAVWYRDHSDDDSLIVADYYRSQMISGVCGGKALIGGLFPLRNVDYLYIQAPGTVQHDLYTLYTTEDLAETIKIIRRYNITHIFYSGNLKTTGYFGTSLQEGYGLEVFLDKFYQLSFEPVYKNNNIIIFKVSL